MSTPLLQRIERTVSVHAQQTPAKVCSQTQNRSMTAIHKFYLQREIYIGLSNIDSPAMDLIWCRNLADCIALFFAFFFLFLLFLILFTVQFGRLRPTCTSVCKSLGQPWQNKSNDSRRVVVIAYIISYSHVWII